MADQKWRPEPAGEVESVNLTTPGGVTTYARLRQRPDGWYHGDPGGSPIFGPGVFGPFASREDALRDARRRYS